MTSEPQQMSPSSTDKPFSNTRAKLAIIDHYEEQIRAVDIYTESLLESRRRCSENKDDDDPVVLTHPASTKTEFYGTDKRTIPDDIDSSDDEEDHKKEHTDDDKTNKIDDKEDNEPYVFKEPYSHKYTFDDDSVMAPTTTTASARTLAEYIDACRMRQIDELNRLLDENLKHYDETIRGTIRSPSTTTTTTTTTTNEHEDLQACLFENKFCVALNLTRLKHMEYGVFGNQSPYNMYVFVTDFYMNSADIELLKYFFVSLYFNLFYIIYLLELFPFLF